MAITGSGAHKLDDHNVTDFPAREKQSSYPERMKTKQNGNYYNNNNYNNNNNFHSAMQRESDRHLETILHGDFEQVYMDSLGRPMPNIVKREVAEMMAKGIHSDLIMAVLEYTAGAPRPSWYYARAVILRNYARGINSEEDFLESLWR